MFLGNADVQEKSRSNNFGFERCAIWSIKITLQSVVDQMSVAGLLSVTIVSRLRVELGGRLATNVDM